MILEQQREPFTVGFLHLDESLLSEYLLPFQYDQTRNALILISFSKRVIMHLQAHKVSVVYGNITSINQSIDNWHKNYCINEDLQTTPVFLNISILPCPPGFYQWDTNGWPSG